MVAKLRRQLARLWGEGYSVQKQKEIYLRHMVGRIDSNLRSDLFREIYSEYPNITVAEEISRLLKLRNTTTNTQLKQDADERLLFLNATVGALDARFSKVAEAYQQTIESRIEAAYTAKKTLIGPVQLDSNPGFEVKVKTGDDGLDARLQDYYTTVWENIREMAAQPGASQNLLIEAIPTTDMTLGYLHSHNAAQYRAEMLQQERERILRDLVGTIVDPQDLDDEPSLERIVYGDNTLPVIPTVLEERDRLEEIKIYADHTDLEDLETPFYVRIKHRLDYLHQKTEAMDSVLAEYQAAMKKAIADAPIDGNHLTLKSLDDILPQREVKASTGSVDRDREIREYCNKIWEDIRKRAAEKKWTRERAATELAHLDMSHDYGHSRVASERARYVQTMESRLTMPDPRTMYPNPVVFDYRGNSYVIQEDKDRVGSVRIIPSNPSDAFNVLLPGSLKFHDKFSPDVTIGIIRAAQSRFKGKHITIEMSGFTEEQRIAAMKEALLDPNITLVFENQPIIRDSYNRQTKEYAHVMQLSSDYNAMLSMVEAMKAGKFTPSVPGQRRSVQAFDSAAAVKKLASDGVLKGYMENIGVKGFVAMYKCDLEEEEALARKELPDLDSGDSGKREAAELKRQERIRARHEHFVEAINDPNNGLTKTQREAILEGISTDNLFLRMQDWMAQPAPALALAPVPPAPPPPPAPGGAGPMPAGAGPGGPLPWVPPTGAGAAVPVPTAPPAVLTGEGHSYDSPTFD